MRYKITCNAITINYINTKPITNTYTGHNSITHWLTTPVYILTADLFFIPALPANYNWPIPNKPLPFLFLSLQYNIKQLKHELMQKTVTPYILLLLSKFHSARSLSCNKLFYSLLCFVGGAKGLSVKTILTFNRFWTHPNFKCHCKSVSKKLDILTTEEVEPYIIFFITLLYNQG